jgi:thioredoxin 2
LTEIVHFRAGYPKGKVREMHPEGTATTDPIEVTDASFRHEVLESPLPVLLDCWAPWCPPCILMAPVIEELARSLAGTVKVAKLNLDGNPKTAGRLGIRSIPTLLLFRDGQVIGEIVGAAPRAGIETAVLRRLRER